MKQISLFKALRPIDTLFYEYLKDNVHMNSRIGDLARKIEKEGIQPGDPRFPNWRDHIDPTYVFGRILDVLENPYGKV